MHNKNQSASLSHLIIRASAGTGKTYQLSNRYLGLIGRDVPLEQILASTFTRKAAGEILERVLLRLAHAALDPDECQKLGEAIGQKSLTTQRCLAMLRQVAQNLHRLRISTLDAFFAQLAGSFSLELGFPPGWTIVEERQDLALRQDAMEQVLASDEDQEVSRLMHLMTKGEATRSVGQLMQDTVANLYALFQQTTEAAWRNFPSQPLLTSEQIAEIVRQLGDAQLPTDKRFQSARNDNIESALAGDWEMFLQKGLAKKILEGESSYCRKPIPEDVLVPYRKLLGHARGHFLKQLEHQTGATFELLVRFDHVYRRRKLDARALRFDDVTQRLADGAALRSLKQVHFRLDSDVAHLLLDEFQDTSYWQWRVLEPFARQVTSPSGRVQGDRSTSQTSFFCVGDVKQAIYGWRGGRSEIFEAIEGQLRGLERDSLTASYRSSPEVIECVNRIFENLHLHPNWNREQGAIEAWKRQFETHSTVHRDRPGYVTLETCRAVSNNKADETLVAAAERVAELVRKAPGREIGVLVRRNKSVARLIFELKQRGIPASEEGGNPLTDSAAVLAMLALLQLIDHPGDRVARFHVAQSPLGPSLGFDDWQDNAQATALARHLRGQLLDEGYGCCLRAWAVPVLPECSRRDASRLQQLVRLAYDYDPQATLRTVDFIEFVKMQRVADPAPTDVRVMTVHQSKGLQFEIVVLADLEFSLVGQPSAYVVKQQDVSSPIERVCLYRNEQIQQLLPDDFQQMFAQGIDQKVLETLCVLYVATTRAVRAMHVVIHPASKSEKSLPRTAAGLLRATLAPEVSANESMVLYENGDPDWHRETEFVARPPVTPVERPRKIQFTSASSRPDPLQRAAPSQLEGGWFVPLRDALRLEGQESLVRGTVIHAWFEEITWLVDFAADRARLREIADQFKPASLDIEQLTDQFLEMLSMPAVKQCLRRSRYLSGKDNATRLSGALTDELEVHNERRFAVIQGSELMSGTIDRLVLLKAKGRVVGAEILDYKTDRIGGDSPPHRLEQAIAYYRPQQEAYRRAVAKLYELKPGEIRLQLIFLHPGVVREL